MMRRLSAILDGVSAALAKATQWLVIAAMGVMMAALVLQIVFRYGVGQALTWSEELALFLFAWSVLLAGSLGVREAYHVRISLLPSALSGRARDLSEWFCDLVALAFGLLLISAGADYVQATINQLSPAVRYPIWALNSAAPVCGLLVTVHALARLFQTHDKKALAI